MANPLKRLFGSSVDLQSSGASVASGSMSAACPTTVDLSASGDYPHGEFVLAAAAGTNFTQLGPVQVILRPLDIDGTNDAPVPTAAYPMRLAGVFSMFAQTATQYQSVFAYDLPRKFEAYLLNNAGQAISAGWTLKFRPFTFEAT